MPEPAWVAWLGFIGALLGAAIGGPFGEWLKDRLASRGQRNEIVSTVRLVMGVLHAFEEICRESLSPAVEPDLSFGPCSPQKLAVLRRFEFDQVRSNLARLSALHPRDSRKSAAAQRLIQHLAVVTTYFDQLKQVTPIRLANPSRPTELTDRVTLADDDRILYDVAFRKLHALSQFLVGIYAKRLGIEGISLVIDREIFEAEQAIASAQLKQASARAVEALERVNEAAVQQRDGAGGARAG